mgnify:CR=1 FL=1
MKQVITMDFACVKIGRFEIESGMDLFVWSHSG